MEYKPFLFKGDNANFLIPDKTKIEIFYVPIIGKMRKLYVKKKDLAGMQSIVQGYLENINFGRVTMWMNEEGRIRNFPLNFRASRLNAGRFGVKDDGKLDCPSRHLGLGIVGDVFFTSITKSGNCCNYHQSAMTHELNSAKKIQLHHFDKDEGYESIVQIHKDMSGNFDPVHWWNMEYASDIE
jgi:hypothetical protein